jgi:hypothetical protein
MCRLPSLATCFIAALSCRLFLARVSLRARPGESGTKAEKGFFALAPRADKNETTLFPLLG